MMDQDKIREGVRLILEGIGEDPNQRRPFGDTGPDRQNVWRDRRRHV